jgi:hypothetical protein
MAPKLSGLHPANPARFKPSRCDHRGIARLAA